MEKNPNLLLSGKLLSYFLASMLFTLLSLVSVAIYNIYFHPLSGYPGSKLCAASNVPYLYAVVKGDAVSWIRSQHVQYGEVIRIGTNKLSYINPQAWKDVFGHRTGGRLENSKDTKFYTPGWEGEHNIISVWDSQEHGRLRKIFSNAFSDKALRLQEPLIRTYVDKLVRTLDDAARNPDSSTATQDLVKLYNCTTFDIIADLVLGKPLGLLDSSELSPWVEAVFNNIRMVAIGGLMLEYPLLARIIKYFTPRSLREQRDLHYKHTNDRVDERLRSSDERPDIWNLVLQKADGKLSLSQMYSNASVFMVGGSETTATLMSGLTYLLLQNPDKLQKLAAEVRGLSKDQLTFECLAHLRYLQACFEETLRLYPPVPTALPREVPKGGNAICGDWIPEGTSIHIPHQVAYRSPANFRDPDSFIPERWMPGSGYDLDRKDMFQPFSFGPRNCLGKNLAYQEMRLVMANVLWHFDLELDPKCTNWFDQKTYILWQKPALWVKVKPIRT